MRLKQKQKKNFDDTTWKKKLKIKIFIHLMSVNPLYSMIGFHIKVH